MHRVPQRARARRWAVRLGFVATAAIGLASCHSGAPTRRPTPPGQPAALDSVAGTYALAACARDPCAPGDTARAYVVGELVLFPDTAAAPKGLRARFAGRANGCFRIRQLRRRRGSYLGLEEQAGLRWARDSSGTLTFALYRSSDASYTVRATVREGVLAGTGRSGGGSWLEAPFTSTDRVAARRTRPPDAGVCPRGEGG